MIALVLLAALASTVLTLVPPSASKRSTGPHLPLPKDLQTLWAQYSPYFPLADYQVPNGCQVTQVNLLQRHGARFPTAGPGAAIASAVHKLQSVPTFHDPRLDFLRNYTYDLGTNDLVPFGAAQSSQSGGQHFTRYEHLFNASNLPFVRASSSERVVLSATNWTAGFAAASHGRFAPVLSVVLNEAANDTLDDNMCPSAGSSDAEDDAWQAVYAPPIAARLNAAAPGANLTTDDVFSLLSQCAFDSVAHERASGFCGMFSQQEFADFEYTGDVDKFYGTGYGQPLGRVQGVGYVNELLARLTGQAVLDHTQTNSTLDSDPATFPLNRTLYADFSHDNQMIAIYAALGLFPQANATALDPTKPDPRRDWIASRLVPFSARMVTERLTCGEEGEQNVRILVNEVVQPLAFCGADERGMCIVSDFVASQSYARSDGAGDFEKCFA